MSRFVVDAALCAGHGLCYTLEPDVFSAAPDGLNADVGRTVELSPDQVDEARSGADSCPEQAIRLFDGTVSV